MRVKGRGYLVSKVSRERDRERERRNEKFVQRDRQNVLKV